MKCLWIVSVPVFAGEVHLEIRTRLKEPISTENYTLQLDEETLNRHLAMRQDENRELEDSTPNSVLGELDIGIDGIYWRTTIDEGWSVEPEIYESMEEHETGTFIKDTGYDIGYTIDAWTAWFRRPYVVYEEQDPYTAPVRPPSDLEY